jgi:hypothetical protein
MWVALMGGNGREVSGCCVVEERADEVSDAADSSSFRSGISVTVVKYYKDGGNNSEVERTWRGHEDC